jgi:intron-binding protein aquarius
MLTAWPWVTRLQVLRDTLGHLPEDRLRALAAQLFVVPAAASLPEEEKESPGALLNGPEHLSPPMLVEVLVDRYRRRLSQLESINDMPLFPTEQMLWDENIVPTEAYTDGSLALPKLHLQFLSLFDYLLRNLNLFNMESMYEIRMDVEENIPRLQAYLDPDGEVRFGGWSRMAHPIHDFALMEVAKPAVGSNHPSAVRADVTLKLDVRDNVRQEWEELKRHDVGFVITLRPTLPPNQVYPDHLSFVERVRADRADGPRPE